MLAALLRCVLISGVSVAVIAVLSACGRVDKDPVAARVGEATITRSAVAHWISAVANHATDDPATQRYQRLKRQVLGLLISLDWLIGEANERGLHVSRQAVDKRLGEVSKSALSAKDGFGGSLSGAGETRPNARFEIEGELAAAGLRRWLVLGHRYNPTKDEVVAFYKQQRQRFVTSERRDFDLANFTSAASAVKAMREIRSGKQRPNMVMLLHESLERPSGSYRGEKAAIERAIFTALPYAIGGPVPLSHSYSLFRVTRIVPATHRSIAQVASAIKKELAAVQRAQLLAEFTREASTKWIARTDCQQGFVVQQCKQYRGQDRSESSFERALAKSTGS
jgi:foldase protein PrsA